MHALLIRRFHRAVPVAALLLLAPLVAPLARAADEKKPETPKPSTPRPPVKAPTRTPATNVPRTPTNVNPTNPASRGAVTPNRGPSIPANNRGPANGTTARGVTPGQVNRGGAPNVSRPANRPAPFANRPQPSTVRYENRPNGGTVARRTNGNPRDVHFASTRGGGDVNVHHNLNGGRRVEYERADHTRIVAERGGHGYVSHPYMYRGREFAHRTYYVRGRAYDRFYSRYEYRPGIYVEVYAPVRYYPVGFYGWVYNPWRAPITYSWGWGGAAWYGYYGPFWHPYPTYTSAYFWLTDYLISQELAAEYQAQVDAQVAMTTPLGSGQVMLNYQTQQLIADEVRRQIALENAEAQQNLQQTAFNAQSSGIGRMLSDNNAHVFVVGSEMDLVDAAGQECAVSQGDVLQYNPAYPLTADGANLLVLASKGGLECRTGLQVQASFEDLQSMQNNMRETIDAGMQDLQSHQGGIPIPPPSAMGQVTQASFAMGAPPPDPTASQEITAQYTEASATEQETLGSAAGAATAVPAAAAPTTISLGMTTDQVIGAMGQPKNILDLGSKKIYVYQDLKITFQNGKVSDVN